MHLRLIVPSDRSERVLDTLVDDPRVTCVVRLPGAARRPEGDVINLAGTTAAGVVTLLLQRIVWRSYLRVKRSVGPVKGGRAR